MKDFLEYLVGRLKDKQAVTVEVKGQHYAVQANGTLGAPVRDLAPQFVKPTFEVSTLSALAELYQQKVDQFPAEVALHVADHVTVELVGLRADEFGSRHVYARATHTAECPFRFGEYIPAEKFLIDFRTSFLFNEEAMKVQKVVSSLESGMSISTADDGLSQSLEIKAGTTSKTGVVLPADGVALIPWRTFRDAAPVESKFLLRLKGVKDSVPHVALFDIDQKWKLDTVNSIAGWLRKHVAGATVIA